MIKIYKADTPVPVAGLSAPSASHLHPPWAFWGARGAVAGMEVPTLSPPPLHEAAQLA